MVDRRELRWFGHQIRLDHSRTDHKGPEGEQRYSYTLSLTSALDVGGRSTPFSGRFTPGKETRYPLYRRLVGPQGRSERVRKISPATWIRSSDRPACSESLNRMSYPGPQLEWVATGSLGRYGKRELRVAGKRKASYGMGRACVEGDEEKGRILQEATRLAKGRKAFGIWVMQPDA